MSSIKQCILEYVLEHNNKVTSRKVMYYILNKKKMKTTDESIRATLRKVLDEEGGTLKACTK